MILIPEGFEARPGFRLVQNQELRWPRRASGVCLRIAKLRRSTSERLWRF